MAFANNYIFHTKADGATWHNGLRISSAVIGKNGIAVDKKEGDWCTPTGQFNLVSVYYRPDRTEELKTDLPVIAITAEMGWCDDVSSSYYNQRISLPFGGSHEKLWREDGLYDVFVVTSHNQNPTVKDKGSAIFVHVVGENPYTAGCLAMDKQTLLKVLEKATISDVWCVDAPVI